MDITRTISHGREGSLISNSESMAKVMKYIWSIETDMKEINRNFAEVVSRFNSIYSCVSDIVNTMELDPDSKSNECISHSCHKERQNKNEDTQVYIVDDAALKILAEEQLEKIISSVVDAMSSMSAVDTTEDEDGDDDGHGEGATVEEMAAADENADNNINHVSEDSGEDDQIDETDEVDHVEKAVPTCTVEEMVADIKRRRRLRQLADQDCDNKSNHFSVDSGDDHDMNGTHESDHGDSKNAKKS